MKAVSLRRRVGLGLFLLAVVGLGAFLLGRGREAKAGHGEESPEGPPLLDVPVKSVRPRRDTDFRITVERPANVEAYFRADIEARVAGEVTWITVAPGSEVNKGDLLVRLFVPDLQADEQEKNDVIGQRQREEQLAEAKAAAARSAVKTALANVEEKKTLLDEAVATTTLRDAQFRRLDGLWRRDALDQNARDEALRNLEVARAAEASARAARVKAEAEVEDARANVKVTEAEVERARQLVRVARSAHKVAQARAEFANVKTPFRGTVVERKVDPGDFVQNASSGHTTPILALERTDIVTVAMRVPDNYAAFVHPGTEAVLEMDRLPGVKIRGKVTRIARSLETAARDRTMRVEVDLWNRPADEYAAFFADKRNHADLKAGPLPLVPEFMGKDPLGRSRLLMADDYGKMTLILKTFGDTYLIPSQAILREGGRTSLYVAEGGKAHLVPVAVQVDDGNLAKVERLGKHGEILGDLTGNEEVIVSNQEELTEGQPVKSSPRGDWAALSPDSKGAH